MDNQRFVTVLKIGLVAVIAIIVIGYALFANRSLVRGSEIRITSHQDGQNVSESFITIEGDVDPISWMTMNDGEILTNKENRFSEDIILAEGLNVIKFEALDKFNRQIENTLRLTYSPNKTN